MFIVPFIAVLRGLVIFLQYSYYTAAYMNLRSAREGKDNTGGIDESKLLTLGKVSHMTLVLFAAFYFVSAYAILGGAAVGFLLSLTYAWPYWNTTILPMLAIYPKLIFPVFFAFVAKQLSFLKVLAERAITSLKTGWTRTKAFIASKLSSKVKDNWSQLTKRITATLVAGWTGTKALFARKKDPAALALATPAPSDRLARFQAAYIKHIIPVFKYLPLLVLAASLYFGAMLFFWAGLAGLTITYLERTNRLPTKFIRVKESVMSWLEFPVTVYGWLFLDTFSKVVQGIGLLLTGASSWAQSILHLRKVKESDYAVVYEKSYLDKIKKQGEALLSEEDETAQRQAKQFFIKNFLLMADRNLSDYFFTTRSHWIHTLDEGIDKNAHIDLALAKDAYTRLFSEEGLPYENYLVLLAGADSFLSFCLEQTQLKDAENLFPTTLRDGTIGEAKNKALYQYLSKNPTNTRQLIDRFVKKMQQDFVTKVKQDEFVNLTPEGILKIKQATQIVLQKINAITSDTPPETVEELRQCYVVTILSEMTKCTNAAIEMAENLLGAPHLTPVKKLTAYLNQLRNNNFDNRMLTLMKLKEQYLSNLRDQAAAYKSKAFQAYADHQEACYKVIRGYDNVHDKSFWGHLIGPAMGLHHSRLEYDLVEKADSLGKHYPLLDFLLSADEITPNLYKYLFYSELPGLESRFEHFAELETYLYERYMQLLTIAGCDEDSILEMAEHIVPAILEEFNNQALTTEEKIKKIITFMAVQEGFVYWDIEECTPPDHPYFHYIKSFFGMDKPLRSLITEDQAPPVTALQDYLDRKISYLPMKATINRSLLRVEATAKSLSPAF